MDSVNEKSESDNSFVQRIEDAFREPEPEIAERLSDREDWIVKQASGRVHMIPPQGDKHQMLALNTSDEKLYSVFNEAASKVSENWGGFHQIGAFDKNGLTAWELWREPEISEEEILKNTKEQMLQIAKNRI